jgi:hypothetical protein
MTGNTETYGKPYDPESLITGAEVAAGKTYADKRQFSTDLAEELAKEGAYTPEELAIIAPR